MPDKSQEERIRQALERALEREKQVKKLLDSVGPAIVQMLQPVLMEMANEIRNMKGAMVEAAQGINVEINPKIDIPPIKVPAAEIDVKVPKLKPPKVNINVPMSELTKEMKEVRKAVSEIQFPFDKLQADVFSSVNMNKPLPVAFAGPDGKVMYPNWGGSKGGGGVATVRWVDDNKDRLASHLYPLPIHLSSVASGFEQSVNISGFSATISATPTNSEGIEYDSDNPQPVTLQSETIVQRQVSGAEDSTNVTQLGGNAIETNEGEVGDGTLRQVQAANSVSSTDIRQLGGTDIAVNEGVANDGTLRVVQAVDSVASVNVVSGSTGATQYDDAGNADPGTGGLAMAKNSAGSVYAHRVGEGDSATALRVVHAADATVSVNIVSGSSAGTERTEEETADPGTGPLALARNSSGSIYVHRVGVGDSATALRTVQAADSMGSTNIQQLGGTAIAVGSGVVGSGTIRQVQAVDSVSSVNIAAQGISLQVKQVSGTAFSTVATGNVAHDATDSGNPVKVGGKARTANPTPVGNGDRVDAGYDDIGRAITKPVNIRDLMKTAYATLSTNTETTLLAAVSAAFLDLVFLKFANTSDGAVTIDIRDKTAGNIVDTWEIPANATQGGALPVPWPQSNQGNAWTVDYNDSDLSNTTVYVSALFSQEV